MAKKVLLATKNRGKVSEVRQILAGSGLEILSGEEIDFPDVEESGTTFEENAIAKAMTVASHTSLPAIADDSGLVVDALGGEPGVKSSRYAGDHATDSENIARLLRELDGVPTEKRTARFVCVAVFAEHHGPTLVAEGACEGRILERPRGRGGFGYDPVFLPDGHELTMAELPTETKNAMSHRGRAFRALAEQLRAAGLLG